MGRLTSLALLLSKIPLSMSERDIIDGCCWRTGGIKIRVTSNGEGLTIRSRPECVGEDSQSLFAEMASLETTGGVF
jgi:hypothetical protein